MLRVATVLSAREWEARLVAAARDTAAIKLVLRAFLPDEVSAHRGSIDVVVAGAETPWVTPTRVASWRRLGIRVVGLHPRLDRPAAERLAAGGADLVLSEDVDPEQIVREIRMLDLGPSPARERRGTVVAITGVSGGAGVTEVALALAWNESGRRATVLVDGDLRFPGLAVRLGLPARPDLCDLVDESLTGEEVSVEQMPSMGRLTVIPGAMRPLDTGLRPDTVLDVAQALAADRVVVVDAGHWPQSRSMVADSDAAVVVAPGTPLGVVRLARLVESWTGPQPELVVNGVLRRRQDDIVVAARRWSGLEPAAVIPMTGRVRSAAAVGAKPARCIRRLLAGCEMSRAD